MSQYTQNILALEQNYLQAEQIKSKIEELKVKLENMNNQYVVMLEAQQLLTTVSDNKVTIKIKKITKNCKGYEFEVATKKDFSDAKVYTVKKNKTVKKTISGLDEDIVYYIRVRAFNSKDGQKVYGNYSKIKKVIL